MQISASKKVFGDYSQIMKSKTLEWFKTAEEDKLRVGLNTQKKANIMSIYQQFKDREEFMSFWMQIPEERRELIKSVQTEEIKALHKECQIECYGE